MVEEDQWWRPWERKDQEKLRWRGWTIGKRISDGEDEREWTRKNLVEKAGKKTARKYLRWRGLTTGKKIRGGEDGEEINTKNLRCRGLIAGHENQKRKRRERRRQRFRGQWGRGSMGQKTTWKLQD